MQKRLSLYRQRLESALNVHEFATSSHCEELTYSRYRASSAGGVSRRDFRELRLPGEVEPRLRPRPLPTGGYSGSPRRQLAPMAFGYAGPVELSGRSAAQPLGLSPTRDSGQSFAVSPTRRGHMGASPTAQSSGMSRGFPAMPSYTYTTQSFDGARYAADRSPTYATQPFDGARYAADRSPTYTTQSFDGARYAADRSPTYTTQSFDGARYAADRSPTYTTQSFDGARYAADRSPTYTTQSFDAARYAADRSPSTASHVTRLASCPERDQLKGRLQKHGFRELSVKGDGNCQFRALADQLYPYYSEEGHEAVRQQIIQQLQAWPLRYCGFIPGGIEDGNPTEVYFAWVDHMSRNFVQGTEVTLSAAADSYGVEIWVFADRLDEITRYEPRSFT